MNTSQAPWRYCRYPGAPELVVQPWPKPYGCHRPPPNYAPMVRSHNHTAHYLSWAWSNSPAGLHHQVLGVRAGQMEHPKRGWSSVSYPHHPHQLWNEPAHLLQSSPHCPCPTCWCGMVTLFLKEKREPERQKTGVFKSQLAFKEMTIREWCRMDL